MFEAGSLIYRIQTVGAGLFKAELQQADEAAKKAAKSVSESAKSTRELGKQSDFLRPRLHQVTGEIRGMSAEAQGASREVGGAMTLIGAAIVATVGLTVKAATDWESAWAGVRKTVDGTEEELAGVEAGLRGMAKELPAAHGEIAAVAEAAGQLGIATENVVAFTRTMIDLGETTNLSAQTAATELARFMNVMGTSQDKVSNLGSSVVELGNNYATTEAEIVAMSQRLSGAARIVGLTEGETLGLAAALSSVGIEAEAGGTAVSKVMINIASAVEEGGDKVAAFAEVAGMSAEEFSAKWRKDPGAALASFVAGLSNMESQGKSTFAVLEGLGITEQRMRDALLRASAASDQFTAAMQTGNEAFAENNALQEEAEKRYETTAAKVAMARNAVVDMAIDLGEHLLPMVVAAAEGVSDLANMVGGLPEPVQGALAILGLLVGVIALAGGAALIAVPKIVAFRTAVQTLTTTMPLATGAVRGFATFMGGPWGVALVAAIAGLTALDAWLKSAQASTEELHASVTNGASSAEDMFATFNKGSLITWNEDLSKLQELLDQMGDNPDVWSTFLSGTQLNNLRSTIVKVGDALGEVAQSDLPSAQRAFSEFAATTDDSAESQWRLLQAMPEYKQSLIEIATANGDYAETMTDAEKQQVLLQYAQEQATKVTDSATEAYLSAADATSQMERTLDSLLSTLDEANGKNQDAISANIDYQRTLRDAQEQIDKAARGVDGFGMGLDEATEAGARNVEMLLDMAQGSRDAADGQYALDGNTDTYLQRLQEGRQSIIDTAIAFGATADEAHDLADEIYALPTEYELQMLADTSAIAEAARKIDAFVAQYNGKQITMSMFLQATGNNQGAAADAARLTGQALRYLQEADGGNVKFFGSGGEHHVAQFARAGDMRVWAEPETGGEWYIPASPAKRARSTQILGQAAAEFGYDLVPTGAASGGSPQLAQAAARAAGPMRIEGTLDLGNGLTGFVRGVLRDDMDDTTVRVWGGDQ